MSSIQTGAAQSGLYVPGAIAASSLTASRVSIGSGSVSVVAVAAGATQAIPVTGMTATGKAIAVLSGAANDATASYVRRVQCGVGSVTVAYDAAATGTAGAFVTLFVLSLA